MASGARYRIFIRETGSDGAQLSHSQKLENPQALKLLFA